MSLRKLFFFYCVLSVASLIGEECSRVYLATYTRSGNHWMRYLIEEVTGVATMSVYCDNDHPLHHPEPIPGWGYAPINGYEGTRKYPTEHDICVVKTHYPQYEAQPFDLLANRKIIRIVRHPIDTFYSHFLYGHEKENEGRQFPKEELLKNINEWKNFQNFWNNQSNVYTIRYEDLYRFPQATLYAVLIAAGHSPSMEDIQRAVTKYPPRGGILKHASFFGQEDLFLIADELEELMMEYGYSKDSVFFDD